MFETDYTSKEKNIYQKIIGLPASYLANILLCVSEMLILKTFKSCRVDFLW